jgi:hypothetical protein
VRTTSLKQIFQNPGSSMQTIAKSKNKVNKATIKTHHIAGVDGEWEREDGSCLSSPFFDVVFMHGL